MRGRASAHKGGSRMRLIQKRRRALLPTAYARLYRGYTDEEGTGGCLLEYISARGTTLRPTFLPFPTVIARLPRHDCLWSSVPFSCLFFFLLFLFTVARITKSIENSGRTLEKLERLRVGERDEITVYVSTYVRSVKWFVVSGLVS